jgi:hypothetical protein
VLESLLEKAQLALEFGRLLFQLQREPHELEFP